MPGPGSPGPRRTAPAPRLPSTRPEAAPPGPTHRPADSGSETSMFTGIIEELGEITAIETPPDAARFTVRGPLVTSDAIHGASIAVNGVCLTVVDPTGSDSLA